MGEDEGMSQGNLTKPFVEVQGRHGSYPYEFDGMGMQFPWV